MSLEDFYKTYINKTGKKTYHQLSRREKENVQMVFRLWNKGLMQFKEDIQKE